MKKQAYMKPAMQVVKIQQAQMLCTSPVELTGVQSTGTGTDWNADDDFDWGGGSTGSGR